VATQLKVAVVDDHQAVGELLCRALDSVEGLSCVGIAESSAAARVLVDEQGPDIVLMDVQLGDDDGLELTAELASADPGLRIVVLTGRTDSNLVQRAATAGACSLLPKNGTLEDVLTAIRTAAVGGLSVHPQLLVELVTSAGHREAVPVLTERELDVLRLLANGSNVRQIGQKLFISEHTARGHVKKVLMKLGAHSQLEAVAVAKRLGLLE
jgi:DNA-binding NarL/FixJ family response regulator